MPSGIRRQIAQPVDAVRNLVANRGLFRLELASFAWMAAEAAYLVGLLVFAFATGGTAAVAFVAVLRALPSVVLTPLILSLADRIAKDRLLRLVVVVRVACVVILAAEVARDVGPASIYLLAAIDAIAAALLRPLRSTLIPALARTPEELVAANVVTTTGDSLAALVGPSVAAVLLAVGGSIASTFVAGTAMMILAFLAVTGISAAGALRPRSRAAGQAGTDRDTDAAASRAEQRPRISRPPRLAVFGELFALRHARLVVACFVAQRLVRGMLAVLVVAASFDVLGLGEPGVGWLTAAIGLGGFVGGIVALGLVGSRRLAVAFSLGMVAWGGGILLSGVVPSVAVVLAFLAVAGVGKVGVDVAGVSLLQRTVPAEQRGRIFGLLEGLISAALAVGPVLASFLVGALGPSAAIVVGGAVPLVLVAVCWPVLRSADEAAVVPEPAFQLLSSVPMFRPLQLTTIEQLAGDAHTESVAAGDAVIRQGEPGSTFYIVVSGRLEAIVDGRPTGELGPGDSFGEIALVRDVPRTATIRALEPTELVVLDRELFLAAVASHGESVAAADAVVEARLAGA